MLLCSWLCRMAPGKCTVFLAFTSLQKRSRQKEREWKEAHREAGLQRSSAGFIFRSCVAGTLCPLPI